MKRIIIGFCLVINTLCHAQNIEWKLIRDSELYDGDYNYIRNIQKNEIVTARGTAITGGSGKMPASYDARIFFENQRYAIDAEAVIPNGTQDLLDENLLTPAVNRRGKTWFNVHSIPILQSKNRETAYKYSENILNYLNKVIEEEWYQDSASWDIETELFQVILSMRHIQTSGIFFVTNITTVQDKREKCG